MRKDDGDEDEDQITYVVEGYNHGNVIRRYSLLLLITFAQLRQLDKICKVSRLVALVILIRWLLNHPFLSHSCEPVARTIPTIYDTLPLDSPVSSPFLTPIGISKKANRLYLHSGFHSQNRIYNNKGPRSWNGNHDRLQPCILSESES
jgi:hypothetical protein